MANKTRKDSRGYMLRPGEYQKSNGRYVYVYKNINNKRHSVSASNLVDLRKKEQQVQKDILDGIDLASADSITINQMFDRYMKNKHNLRETTRNNYLYMYNHFVRDGFGQRKLSKVRYSDVQEYYYSIIIEEKMKACTLESINTLLHPTFQLAVRDGFIRTNPTDGVMNEIKKSDVWDKTRRKALTIDQQKAFMNYLENTREFTGWVPIITILLGTGMRIGECLGLRWQDLDFDNRTIDINHSIAFRKIEGRDTGKLVSDTKTEAGRRIIPMIDEVYDAFLQEYSFQRITGFCEEEIDGYSGFVFTTSTGNVLTATEVNKAIASIISSYNEAEKELAKIELREPVELPHFSAHVLRHTFCTRFCENESNFKVIQTIMGHSDITTTLDIYTDVTTEKKQEVLYNMQDKIFIK